MSKAMQKIYFSQETTKLSFQITRQLDVCHLVPAVSFKEISNLIQMLPKVVFETLRQDGLTILVDFFSGYINRPHSCYKRRKTG